MTKKNKLTSDFKTDDINIIGISTAMPDYHIVWHINNKSTIDFIKKQDFLFLPPNKEEEVPFSYYAFNDKEHFLHYCFISNKNLNNYLIPEYRNFDYILIIKGNANISTVEGFIQDIKSIKNIALVMTLNLKKIKHLDLIMNDLEIFNLHINTEL